MLDPEASRLPCLKFGLETPLGVFAPIMYPERMKSIEELTKGSIRIPKKAMTGIAPGIAIAAILVSKGDIGVLMVFIAGIGVGVLTGRGFFEADEADKDNTTLEE